MSKEEILNEINYQGKYTKEVKKKLNKLIKKYHPDNNKEDNKTILILYEIKKEIESNTLEYKIKNNNNITKEDKNYIFFLESMLERFKKERERINNEINALYRKLNKLIKDKNEKQEELYKDEYNLLSLNSELEELSKIDILDRLVLFIILVLFGGLIIFKNIFILVLIVLILLLEIYYIYIRYSNYQEKRKIIKQVKKEYNNKVKEYNNLENNVEKLEKEEIKLKRKRSKINNSIQYYSRQINIVRENEKEETYNRRKN